MAKEVKAMKNRVGPEMHCDISEARFPCLGICCEAHKGVLAPQYLGICPLLLSHDASDRQHDAANRDII